MYCVVFSDLVHSRHRDSKYEQQQDRLHRQNGLVCASPNGCTNNTLQRCQKVLEIYVAASVERGQPRLCYFYCLGTRGTMHTHTHTNSADVLEC